MLIKVLISGDNTYQNWQSQVGIEVIIYGCSNSPIPNIQESKKAANSIFVWYPKERADGSEFLKMSKHKYLCIRNEDHKHV